MPICFNLKFSIKHFCVKISKTVKSCVLYSIHCILLTCSAVCCCCDSSDFHWAELRFSDSVKSYRILTISFSPSAEKCMQTKSYIMGGGGEGGRDWERNVFSWCFFFPTTLSLCSWVLQLIYPFWGPQNFRQLVNCLTRVHRYTGQVCHAVLLFSVYQRRELIPKQIILPLLVKCLQSITTSFINRVPSTDQKWNNC